MIKSKGVIELVDAAKVLIQKNKAYFFHFVGEGSEKLKLEKIVEEEGFLDNCKFYGAIEHDEIVCLLNSSDILVLPSYREGVPNVIMEALACGLPVVATNVGGIPEIINTKNGILLKSHNMKDIVQGIEKCMMQVWSPNVIRATIADFTWERNVQQLVNIIK
jgi:glycosyltransferase involved in cell wall biosynthesis